jgi:hypothetical protein
MTPKTDNPKTDTSKTEAAAKPEPTSKFAVVKAFWLDTKLCAEGAEVLLTDSQAKRAGDSIKAA